MRSGKKNMFFCLVTRELKQRCFWATNVNRKFMFLLLARFHARPMSYKALISAYTTWLFEWKGCITHQLSTSGWRLWLKNRPYSQGNPSPTISRLVSSPSTGGYCFHAHCVDLFYTRIIWKIKMLLLSHLGCTLDKHSLQRISYLDRRSSTIS